MTPWQQRIEDQFTDGESVIVKGYHPEAFFEWGGIPSGVNNQGIILTINRIKGIQLPERWIPLKYIDGVEKI